MNEPSAPPPRRRKFISGPRRLLGVVVLLAAGYPFFLIFSGRVTTFEIDGRSMEPTLQPGDRVFVDSRLADPLERGDLVIFPNPTPMWESEVLVKRVIALPGDRVEILSHRLHVNGARELIPGLDDLLVPDIERDWEHTLLPGEIYVLGDSRANSQDSSEFGPLPDTAVIGRLTFRYWPLSRLGYVN